MARSSGGLTLVLVLAIVVAVPLGTMVWYRGWRARLLEPLPPLPVHTELELQEHGQPEPPSAPVADLRPVDKLLIGVFEGDGPAPGTDLLPGGPRVDLEPGAERGTARIDLDRDGHWDEEWAIGYDSIVRMVSPNDDGKLTERSEWMAGNWVPKPVATQ